MPSSSLQYPLVYKSWHHLWHHSWHRPGRVFVPCRDVPSKNGSDPRLSHEVKGNVMRQGRATASFPPRTLQSPPGQLRPGLALEPRGPNAGQFQRCRQLGHETSECLCSRHRSDPSLPVALNHRFQAMARTLANLETLNDRSLPTDTCSRNENRGRTSSAHGTDIWRKVTTCNRGHIWQERHDGHR